MTGYAATDSVTAMLRQAVAGDEVAFARIVAAYHADMVRVAYGICGEQDLALDAVQSAWMIAWRKLRSVRQPDRLRSWLVAVAANEARHLVRRRGRRRLVELAMHPPDTGSPDPADEIRRVDLVNALQRLKPEERSLIALRYGADLDSAEIGPLLGLTASGVRARLARLMGRLRKELGDA
jgi:RNA polymerase sigma-70 factor (ECF subfamily)